MSKIYDDNVSVQMEHNIAAALLADPELWYPQIQNIITPADFQSSMARTVYIVVETLLKENKKIDPYTVLFKASEMDLPLDEQFCREALSITSTTVNTVVYAESVHAQAIARAVDDVGMKILQGELDSSSAIAELQDLNRKKNISIESPQEAANNMMDYINNNLAGKKTPFVPTGFYNLDSILSGGMMAGGLITLAARPGTGKTTAGVCIAENVAAKKIPVLYVSLEMTSLQIWTCRIANYAGLNRSEIATGNYSGTEPDVEKKIKRSCTAIESMYDIPFYIRDVPSSLEDIEREARSIPNIGLIVIDHIGLMRPPAGCGKGRYEIMTEISHRLKQLALSMQIPILALCQLNRGSLERKDRKPTMADLRDSGAIEEDSDCVILLFRDDSNTDTSSVQKIRFIVDKNRHGMTGDVDLNFIGSMSRICV